MTATTTPMPVARAILARHLDSPKPRIEQVPQDAEGNDERDRDRQHLIPLFRGGRVPHGVDELVLAAGEENEQRPTGPSQHEAPEHPRSRRAHTQEHGQPDRRPPRPRRATRPGR